MRESILVTGCQGQLGRRLVNSLGTEAVGISRKICDLSDRRRVYEVVRAIRPRIVINAAAYTDVDGAEDDVDECRRVNVDGVVSLAQACNDVDARLIHISTDYVFGNSPAHAAPHQEDDLPSPVGAYALSKLDGEVAARTANKHCIVRTCGLYDVPSPEGRGKNFCNTMIRLANRQDLIRVVDDQHCNPSYVPDVTDAVIDLVRREAQSVYHVVNGPPTTWFRFARHLLGKTGLDVRVEPITSAEYASRVRRPTNSVLSTKKFESTCGYVLRSWEESLDDYLVRLDSHRLATECHRHKPSVA